MSTTSVAKTVIKRDGRRVPFDEEKIFDTIVKAAKATHDFYLGVRSCFKTPYASLITHSRCQGGASDMPKKQPDRILSNNRRIKSMSGTGGFKTAS